MEKKPTITKEKNNKSIYLYECASCNKSFIFDKKLLFELCRVCGNILTEEGNNERED